ncbi:hypothetical protein A0O28_0044060 [Trichoderma guizhouense]|uniref:NACHT domain-containing protein n=1 Tax=Trichoderma guizhouense TaxID=1491466 RepID=A0A1T3C8S8_9HYPO|nr:hypothetical protein A0O28_0044060 [Trichoderma guizhouense]
MMRSFPRIRFGLMVGIGGGAPGEPSNDPRNDIRLGDVVVSCPTVDSSGVLQYDFGKTMREGKFVQTGTLNKTHIELRNGVSVLQANHRKEISQVPSHIDAILQSNRKMGGYFDHPGLEHDQLFRADYDHVDGESSCETCDRGALLVRKPRADKDPAIHYGLIGSANQVMKHGMTREKLRKEKGILCFEMEAAGLMDILPCLVIRGICDYADSHKNKRWQPYAAAVAAAYAKEILSVIPASEVSSTFTLDADTIKDTLRTLISALTLRELLQLLPGLKPSQRKSTIPNLDPGDPRFSWVFKNLDYESWRSNDSGFVLCLSNPLAHHLSQVSSYIVDQEEKANRPVLYCFCSQITNGEFSKGLQDVEDQNSALASALIYTLLDQIIRLSPTEKIVPIMRLILYDLLQKFFKTEASQHWTENVFDCRSLPNGLRSMLSNTATKDLLAAFHQTLDYVKPQPTLIVLDGIEKAYQGGRFLKIISLLINDLRQHNPKIKAVLAGPVLCDITALSQESVFIEYDKERRECLSSLRFENTRYEKISPEHSGSFDWIWTHDEYKSWSISETSRLLYIQGKPGSGKSTLTKYFDSNLRTREPAAKQAIVARFFYSFREGELQRSHYNMLLSLLYDILYQEEAFFYHHCQTEYRSHRRSGEKWDYTSLKKILGSLQDYYSAGRQFYFIIDAVDESENADRRDMINLLCSLCSNIKYCVVKIFISSRPVTQLEARRDQFLNFIRLQDETMLDISNFANSLLGGLDLDLTREITYIIENAQGVFLWVKLVGEELLRLHEDGYSEHDIFLTLKQLPTELEEVYALMLDKMRANKSCLSYGLRMLRFILFAQRPLRVNELLHYLGIPENIESNSMFNLSDEIFDKGVPSERIIISCGGNFIEITQQDDEHRVVQVIHQTALEFLRDPNGVVSRSEFRIDEERAHMTIAATCIRYLMVCATNTFLRAGLQDSEYWISKHYEYYIKYLDRRPLTFYPFHHLKHHVDSCKGYVSQHSTQDLAAQLISNWIHDPFNYLLESWVGSPLEPIVSNGIRHGLLIAAAKDGFDAVLAGMLVLIGVDVVSITEESGRTPLSWAAGNGQESTIRLLLKHMANIDSQDLFGRTPLSWAAENGQESAIKLLLEHQADVNPPDHFGWTPLIWAAGNAQESTVRLLLENGADVHYFQNYSKRTPLISAAGNGRESAVKLLLHEEYADVNFADSDGRTPLSWAAGNGQESAVELLLGKNADSNIPDSQGRTPLSWAAGNGQESAVRLLLEKNADVNLPDSHGLTPLSWAAGNGHQPIVELLLLRGACVNASDKWASPLWWATRNEDSAIIELLRNNGATL